MDERIAGPCWIWQGTIGPKGYGQTAVDGKTILAHRLSYEQHVGPIPEDLVIDHLCRVRACYNPAHLEPVTVTENNRRGMSPSARTCRDGVCQRGHQMSADNVYVSPCGKRQCRTCRAMRREGEQARARSRRAACLARSA